METKTNMEETNKWEETGHSTKTITTAMAINNPTKDTSQLNNSLFHNRVKDSNPK
jgi:hypothetical protein